MNKKLEEINKSSENLAKKSIELTQIEDRLTTAYVELKNAANNFAEAQKNLMNTILKTGGSNKPPEEVN